MDIRGIYRILGRPSADQSRGWLRASCRHVEEAFGWMTCTWGLPSWWSGQEYQVSLHYLCFLALCCLRFALEPMKLHSLHWYFTFSCIASICAFRLASLVNLKSHWLQLYVIPLCIASWWIFIPSKVLNTLSQPGHSYDLAEFDCNSVLKLTSYSDWPSLLGLSDVWTLTGYFILKSTSERVTEKSIYEDVQIPDRLNITRIFFQT